MKWSSRLCRGFMFALVSSFSPAMAETVTLSSLDWCPYACASGSGQGVTLAVVRDAFKSQGYDLNVRFLPWNRAVNDARMDTDVAGYFPEYNGPVQGFVLSAPVGYGPLGLVEQVDRPVEWKSVDDLSHLTLGVVRGYLNTPALDQRIAQGRQKVELSVDDASNIRKVGAGRMDAAVIDVHVFNYLMKNDPSLAFFKGKVRMSGHLLDSKSLHVAFSDTDYGRRMAAVFAAGLKTIDVKALQSSYMHNSFTD